MVVFVAASAPGASACTIVTEHLVAPTLTASPPAYSSPAFDNTVTYFVFGIPVGLPYSLSAVAPQQPACPIVNPCLFLPDFNIVWYQQGSGMFDEQVANHNQAGDQVGIIPLNADFGVVYMRYGPDFSLGELVFGDGKAEGALFQLKLGTGCP